VDEPGVLHGALGIGLEVFGAFDHLGELEGEVATRPRNYGAAGLRGEGMAARLALAAEREV
jgi:hypothetical protein